MHVNLDHESMTKISLKSHNNLTKLNARQAAYVYVVFKKYHHMALVGLWHIKEELCKGFFKISNKIPKHLNIMSGGHIIQTISQTSTT